jgi:hypothetical protein
LKNKEPVKRILFDGIDWRTQVVPGNSGIYYVANGIELMCRIYFVQMIGRLKNLYHWMNLWWDCYFDNNINKLTIHETEIHYCDKVSTGKGDTVFSVTELELFNTFCHCAPANLSTKLAIVDIITVIQRAWNEPSCWCIRLWSFLSACLFYLRSNDRIFSSFFRVYLSATTRSFL